MNGWIREETDDEVAGGNFISVKSNWLESSVFLLQMNGWVREEIDDEVAGGRASLATKCGIPVSDIQGFRQPFLQASPAVREVSCMTVGLFGGSRFRPCPRSGEVWFDSVPSSFGRGARRGRRSRQL